MNEPDDLKELPPPDEDGEDGPEQALTIPEIISIDLVQNLSRNNYILALKRTEAALSENFEDPKLRLAQGKLGLDTIKHIEQHNLAALQLERSRSGQETARQVLELRKQMEQLAQLKARIDANEKKK